MAKAAADLLVAILFVLGVGIPPRGRTVAITFDDLPYATGADRAPGPADSDAAEAINRAIVAGLKRHQVPVTGFVIQSRAEALGDRVGARILTRWIAATFNLGNHTYSHPDINQLSVDQIDTEIVRGETTIRPLMTHAGRRLEFFRFPYNHTGDTRDKHDRVAAFLSRRGYRVATCTMQNDDWAFNTAYVRMLARSDTAAEARLRGTYLDYTRTTIAYYAALSRQVLGYEPPQVMLLHDNALNADVIDSLLALFTAAQYRFVSLGAAQSDPAYQIPDTVTSPNGPMWEYRWAQARHVTVNGALEPQPPTWVVAAYP